MAYNILAIFNDVQLKEIEEISLCTLMTQGVRNQMVKACDDYRYLVSSLYAARGLTQQVILFLLDPKSCTLLGADEFLNKLEYWVQILEDENEQRMYADILRNSYYEEDELLTLRFNLIAILLELDVKRTLKKTKNSQDILVKNKIPMQLAEGFQDSYATFMMNYGSEFEDNNSSFNIVPDLRGRISEDQPSFYEAFRVDLENWKPFIQGSEIIID